MATYTAQKIGSTGLGATYNAASGTGDRVPPGSLLHVKNGNAAATDLTLVTPQVHDTDLAVADRVVTIPATNGERFVRVPDNTIYRAADGLVDITWTVTATVTFAVLV